MLRQQPWYDDTDNAAMAEINITPFIDVMLVLLIIFMVAAPLMLGGVHINLPKTAATPMPRPVHPIIVSIDANNQIFVDKEMVHNDSRPQYFKDLAIGSETGEVYVRGDGEVKYAVVMQLMSELGEAGFSRVTLVAAVGGSQTEGPHEPSTQGKANRLTQGEAGTLTQGDNLTNGTVGKSRGV